MVLTRWRGILAEFEFHHYAVRVPASFARVVETLSLRVGNELERNWLFTGVHRQGKGFLKKSKRSRRRAHSSGVTRRHEAKRHFFKNGDPFKGSTIAARGKGTLTSREGEFRASPLRGAAEH